MNEIKRLNHLLNSSTQDVELLCQNIWRLKQELEALKQKVPDLLRQVEYLNQELPAASRQSEFDDMSDCDWFST